MTDSIELPDYPELEEANLDTPIGIEDTEQAFDQLKTACENLEYLVDLHDTIKNEGVSKADVQDILNIQEQYRSSNGELPIETSLESYLGMFTAARSTLNKKISMEGVASNIINTIRKWIDYLVEFVAKIIRWFKGWQHRDDQIRSKINVAKLKLKIVKAAYQSAIEANFRSDRDLTEQFVKVANQLLTDPSLPKTPATLMYLGVMDREKPFKYLTVAINDGVQQAKNNFATLEKQLDDTNNVNQAIISNAKLTFALDNIKQFTVVSDDADYLTNSVPWDFYKSIDSTLKLEIPQYQAVYDLYGEFADRLRKMKRISSQLVDQQQMEQIKKSIEILTDSLKQMNELIENCAIIRDCAYKAIATQFNYYVQAAKIIRSDYYSHIVGDLGKQAYHKFEQALKEAAVSMGI